MLSNGTDYLAADSQSASYRTGRIDPLISKISLSLRRGVSNNPRIYLPKLISFFKKNTQNNYHLVKVFHDWITDNVSYDRDKFYGKTRGYFRPHDVLRVKRTTCGGFTKLLNEMCRLAGINSVYVRGTSRNYVRVRSGKRAGHAWNGVLIKNKWYVVDTTHDGRRSYKNGIFGKKKKYKDTYLFIKPEYKLLTNYPHKREFQFTKNFHSFEKFIHAKKISIFFKKFNLHFVENNDYDKILKSKEKHESGIFYYTYDAVKTQRAQIITLKIKAPEYIRFLVRLKSMKNKKFYGKGFHYKEGGMRIVKFNAPYAGTFKAYIYAKDLRQKNRYQSVYSFLIKNSSGRGQTLPADLEFYNQATAEYFKIKRSLIKELNNFLILRLQYPGNVKAFCAPYDFKRKRIKNQTKFSYLNNGRLYFIKKPSSQAAWLKVFGKWKNDRSYTQVMVKKILPIKTLISTPIPLRYYRRTSSSIKYGVNLTDFKARKLSSYNYRVIASCAEGVKLRMSLYQYQGGERGEKIRNAILLNQNNNKYSFDIRLPHSGLYKGYIWAKKENEERFRYASVVFYLKR